MLADAQMGRLRWLALVGGALLLAVVLARPAHAGDIAAAPNGERAAAFLFPPRDGNPLKFTARSPGGAFSPAQTISRGVPRERAIDTDARGNTVVAWTEGDNYSARLKAAYRPAGGALEAPVELSGPAAYAPAVAFDPSGRAVVAWSMRNGAMRVAERPPGGRFGPPVDLPDGGQVLGLRIAPDGEALLVSLLSPPDSTGGLLQTSVRPPGGAFAPARGFARVRAVYERNAVTGNAAGDTLLVYYGEGGLVAARRPAHGEFGAPEPVPDARDRGCGNDVQGVALGPDGYALVVWRQDEPGFDDCLDQESRLRLAEAQPGAGFAKPVELSSRERPAYAAGVAANGRGDVAVVWGTARFGLRARYRRAGAALGPAFDLAARSDDGFPSVAVDGAGAATALWATTDGARDRLLARDFRSAPGARAVTVAQAPTFRPLPDGRRRCTPRGSRTILVTSKARVYQQGKRDDRIYACLYVRGVPIELFSGDEGAISSPPAMALTGPLLAYSYEFPLCGPCGVVAGLSVTDLRTGQTAAGYGPAEDPDVENEEGGLITRLVLTPRAGVAYITCEAIRRGDCRGPGRVSRVWKIGAGAPRPVRVGEGKGIDPLSLRLKGERITWRDGRRTRAASLR